MCDYEVKSQTNLDGSAQLGDQPSLDLQELWNLVENSSSPLPPTQIVDSQGSFILNLFLSLRESIRISFYAFILFLTFRFNFISF